MITDRKGLSTIVATLIIILLVLVAIGIVWVVVKGLISTTEGQIDIQKKCLGIDLEVTDKVFAAVSSVTVKTSGEISSGMGMTAAFSGASGVIGTPTDKTPVTSLTTVSAATGSIPTKVIVSIYFLDGTDKVYCSQTAEYP